MFSIRAVHAVLHQPVHLCPPHHAVSGSCHRQFPGGKLSLSNFGRFCFHRTACSKRYNICPGCRFEQQKHESRNALKQEGRRNSGCWEGAWVWWCVCGFAFSALFLLLCLHSDRVCSPWLARYPGHYCHRECGCVFHAGGTRRHALSGTELLFWLEHRDLHASIFFSCLKKLNQCVNVLFQVSLWFISLWL